MRGRTILAGIALGTAVAVSAAVPALAANKSGFKTTKPPMLSVGDKAGVQIEPLLTVGDVLPSGYRFEAIPDGISVRTRGRGRVDLLVNHETSKVPFPYNTAAPTAANGENDFDNAQVSRLILNQHSAGVLNGSFVIPSSPGLPALLLQLPRDRRRRASAASIFFTNEESPDYVFRQEDSWPPPIGDPAEERGRPRGRARRPDRQDTTRSTGWAGTTTRTASRSPGTGTRSSSPATTRSRAGRSARFPAVRRGPVAVAALFVHRAEHGRPAWRTRATCGRSSRTRRA